MQALLSLVRAARQDNYLGIFIVEGQQWSDVKTPAFAGIWYKCFYGQVDLLDSFAMKRTPAQRYEQRFVTYVVLVVPFDEFCIQCSIISERIMFYGCSPVIVAWRALIMDNSTFAA